MTSRISFIVGVAVVALAVGAPSALGKGQPVSQPTTSGSPAYKALLIRSEALNKKYGLGDFEAAHHKALRLRGEGMNRKYGLGEFAPTAPVESAHHKALRLRGEGMNRKYGLGEFASSPDAGIEWSQIGIGIVMALVLVIGVGVAVRVTRVRTLAH
jgi:hypothetical protein